MLCSFLRTSVLVHDFSSWCGFKKKRGHKKQVNVHEKLKYNTCSYPSHQTLIFFFFLLNLECLLLSSFKYLMSFL